VTSDIGLRIQTERSVPRRLEPVRFGLPLASAAVPEGTSLALVDARGTAVPAEIRATERWRDGSARWLLIDAAITTGADVSLEGYRLVHAAEPPESASRLSMATTGDLVTVTSGASHFEIAQRGEFSLVHDSGIGLSLRCAPATGQPLTSGVRHVTTKPGPLRGEVVVSGRFVERPSLQFSVRCTFFADLAAVAIDVTILNSGRAEHPGGHWELGDGGSILLRELALNVSFPQPADAFRISPERNSPLEPADLPIEIYQESSGGERWNSGTHRDRTGAVPMQHKGYRLSTGSGERTGLRATPIVTCQAGIPFAVTVPRFWQEFPRDIRATADGMTIGLLSGRFPSAHELQGGERKAHSCVMSFGPDPVTGIPLDWCRSPLLVSASPGHYSAAESVSYLRPAEDCDRRYNELVRAAVAGSKSFFAKRETADEFGWRHFGDLYADHEAVRQPPDQPLASHYNNQYDGIAGLAVQFMRFGDSAWWHLCDDLARHVADIDLYHTQEDKAGYNGGLFWHTYHYVDAGRSTHRCYSKSTAPNGGGPSNEHNYTTGLMLHYLLTGHEPSRDAVIQLADWVVAMDDGQLTPLRWLTGQATGFASATVSTSYQGPGRGAANSVNALLDAHRLSGERRYLDAAEEIIRRCIHPRDDVAGRDLLDTERRWSYTVFLQLLGKFLEYKLTLGEADEMYAYAQTSLVRYAAWMAEHEYPYLQRPEKLEFPTETWAAQDLRKSEVFRIAARHNDEMRERFVERSRFFYETSITTLEAAPTRTLTRPLVLMLSNGYQQDMVDDGSRPPVVAWTGTSVPAVFVPQKVIARNRLVAMAIAGAAGVVAAIVMWVT